MDNLVLLKKQFRRPVKIMLVIVDIMWASYIAFFAVTGDLKELFPMGGLLIVLILLNVSLLEARRPEPYLKVLSSDVLKTVNEECMTGFRCGNGILCESGCLLIVGMTVKVFLPRNVKMIDSVGMQGD